MCVADDGSFKSNSTNEKQVHSNLKYFGICSVWHMLYAIDVPKEIDIESADVKIRFNKLTFELVN